MRLHSTSLAKTHSLGSPTVAQTGLHVRFHVMHATHEQAMRWRNEHSCIISQSKHCCADGIAQGSQISFCTVVFSTKLALGPPVDHIILTEPKIFTGTELQPLLLPSPLCRCLQRLNGAVDATHNMESAYAAQSCTRHCNCSNCAIEILSNLISTVGEKARRRKVCPDCSPIAQQ